MADVVVVPECPKVDESEHARWFGTNPRKGLAVFSAPGFSLSHLQIDAQLPRYVIPLQVSGSVSFMLLAVWAQNDGSDRYVRGVVRAARLCEHLIRSQPTVMLGDFNSNTTWDDLHPKDRNHSALVALLNDYGLVSSYHERHGEQHGSETRATFYEYRRETLPFHIDFCFLPTEWRHLIRTVTVGSFAEWSALSDHVPLVVDVNPNAG